MCICIYTHIWGGSTLFATTASTETLNGPNGTIWGVTCFRGAKPQLHPKPNRTV